MQCLREHGLDRAQAEVIVVLLRELLLHEVVQRVHLLREYLGPGWGGYNVRLYAMLLCSATLRYATLRYATLCYAMFGRCEALGEEHDLDDQRNVRLHHRHRPQQRLHSTA